MSGATRSSTTSRLLSLYTSFIKRRMTSLLFSADTSAPPLSAFVVRRHHTPEPKAAYLAYSQYSSLFTQPRRRGILRTSPFGHSRLLFVKRRCARASANPP